MYRVEMTRPRLDSMMKRVQRRMRTSGAGRWEVRGVHVFWNLDFSLVGLVFVQREMNRWDFDTNLGSSFADFSALFPSSLFKSADRGVRRKEFSVGLLNSPRSRQDESEP